MSQTTPQAASLKVSIETGKNKWLLTMSSGGQGRRRTELAAGDLSEFKHQVEKGLRQFKLGEKVKVFCCYEAGRDGFWIYRALTQMGYTVYVVDASSIEVPQQRRRRKTDRIDGEKLLRLLFRHLNGERAFALVRVPHERDEDARRLHRELERLTKERIGHANRIESLLATHGIRLKITPDFAQQLERTRKWDGSALGADLTLELKREYERLSLLQQQLKKLKAERERRLEAAVAQAQAKGKPAERKASLDEEQQRQQRRYEQVIHLSGLKGVGVNSAWKLVFEFFGWREFRNRREVGGLAGLTGTPYNSGESERDQGISKAGNWRIRTLMVELAWLWLRYQPDTKITKWFRDRATKGKRCKRQAIVAVARQLLVALWRYEQFGEIPEGARLKNAA